MSRQKRYSFADPLLRLWVRLHCRPVPPSDDDVAREVQAYAHGAPAAAPSRRSRCAGAPARRAEREKNWGIIEID